ncbi:hypothetical protein [Vibrio spartinae]|uniref:Uncharacterized protein n=1 Tax=Vibrio spartinae TaxID=1918945 RepID=A0A1N6M5W5_9VIBR|nr:hypothetical protein [Vibrio spartinae]QMV14894.1 hypothetical protein Vspart_02170 [Vibrio spartinae]SIO94831.1 hypothetical protein VSP9026_02561 [Vibrio spartinae]
MDELGNQAAKQANLSLSREQEALLVKTSVDLDALAPLVYDKEELVALRNAIKESTERNENCAQLVARLQNTAQISNEIIGKVVNVIKGTVV